MRFFQEVGQIKLQNRRPILVVFWLLMFFVHFEFSVTSVCVGRIEDSRRKCAAAINYIQRRIYCPIMEMLCCKTDAQVTGLHPWFSEIWWQIP